MDKLIKKLTKLLSKYGVSEDKVEKIINDLDDADESAMDDETPTDVEETPNEDSETPTNEDAETPVEGEENAPEDDNSEPVEDGSDATPNVEEMPTDVPPVEGDVNPADLIPPQGEVPPSDVPQDDMQPQVPVAQDNEMMLELQSKIDNLTTALDGMSAKYDALMNSLKESGIMVDSGASTPVGVDRTGTPANDPQDDPMDSILQRINRGY